MFPWNHAVLESSSHLNYTNGVFSARISESDPNITYYRSIGGAHFHERAAESLAMTTLDTPIYQRTARALADRLDERAIVLDIGGGDGRMAWPLLERGKRVVVLDVAGEALARFRARVSEAHPEWLESLMLVEGDARTLPFSTECMDAAIAIESLYYLNEDYELGLAEAVRTLKRNGILIVSERDYEGSLILQLLYRGLSAALDAAPTRDVYDGPGSSVRTRCFTAEELRETLERHGLVIRSERGISLLSTVVGWMRGNDRISEADRSRTNELQKLLLTLSDTCSIRRCHVVEASKSQGADTAGIEV